MTARLWFIETKRSVAVWFVPVMALTGWWVSDDVNVNGLKLWGETRIQFGLAMVVIVPIAGAVAAWVAGRERRRGLGDALGALPTPAFARDLAAWGAVVAWCALAFLGVVVVRGVEVALDATWGGPDLVGIGVGGACIAAATAFGYLVGALVPSRFAAILAAAALALGENQVDRYAYSSLVQDSFVRYLSPWTYLYDRWELAAGDQGYGGSLLLWLGGITATLLAAVALLRGRSRASWTALAASLIVAALGAAATAWLGPSGVGWAAAATPVCVEATIPVCLHPAYGKFLDETAAVVEPVVAPVIGLPGAPTRAVHGETLRRAPTDDTLSIDYHDGKGSADWLAQQIALDLATSHETIAPGVDPRRIPNPVQIAVARWLVDRAGYVAGFARDWAMNRSSCWEMSEPPGPERVPERPREIPGCRAAIDAEIRAAIARFELIPPAERRAWLERNFADLRAGRIGLEDLP